MKFSRPETGRRVFGKETPIPETRLPVSETHLPVPRSGLHIPEAGPRVAPSRRGAV